MSERRICDYEGGCYRTDFWEGKGREYEDIVERAALGGMLPAGGERILEIGAGFGRLADLYGGYRQIVLTDYARSQLEDAARYLGGRVDMARVKLVVADVYNLPFADGVADALTTVRVMHHISDVPSALREMHRVVRPGGTAVIEHASKRHLKSIGRWLLRMQDWSPFSQEPYEFEEMNFDFHPAWMRRRLEEAGFNIEEVRTLSHFRVPLLKRLFPARALAALDDVAQTTGRWWQLTPSVMLRAGVKKEDAQPETGLFRCPACKSPGMRETGDALVCGDCGRGWPIEGGIYNLRLAG